LSQATVIADYPFSLYQHILLCHYADIFSVSTRPLQQNPHNFICCYYCC